MKFSLVLISINLLVILYAALYIPISDHLSLLAPLGLLVLSGSLAMLFLMGVRRFVRHQQWRLLGVVVTTQTLVALLVLDIMLHARFVDIAFHLSSARRVSLVSTVVQAQQHGVQPSFPEWNGGGSNRERVYLQRDVGVDAIFITATTGWWDLAGFLYISDDTAPPHCVIGSRDPIEKRRMAPHWYWLTCGD